MRIPFVRKPKKGKGTLVVGSNVVDITIHSKKYFRILDKKFLGFLFDSKMEVDNSEIGVGGSAHNVAINLAHLGDKAYLLGAVGNGPYRDLILKNLSGYGVNTKYISKNDAPSGSSIVFIHKGEKTVLFHGGANSLLGADDFDERVLDKVCRIVITSMTSPQNIRLISKISRLAKKRKIYLVTNPSMRMVENRPKELKTLMNRSDCIIMNDLEAKRLTRKKTVADAIHSLESYGAKTVIVTQNSRGNLLYENGTLLRVPSHKVKVVNTTGAGDSFTAGFLHAKNGGCNSLDAVKFANALAALVIQTPGASVDLPSKEKIASLMRST